MMKHFISTFMLLIGINLFSGVSYGEEISSKTQKLERLTEQSFDMNSEVSSHAFTIVQFWASWCSGCGVVMEDIATRKSKNSSFGFVSVSLDETKEQALKFFMPRSPGAKNFMSSTLLDPSGSAVATAAGVDSLPYLVIVSREGKIVKRIKGHPRESDWNEWMGTFK